MLHYCNAGKLPQPLSGKKASLFIDVYQAGLWYLERYVHHMPDTTLDQKTVRWLNQLIVLLALALARIPFPKEKLPPRETIDDDDDDDASVKSSSSPSSLCSAFVFVREPKLAECKFVHMVPVLLCATAQICSADRERYFQDTPEEAITRQEVQAAWGDKGKKSEDAKTVALKAPTRLETVQYGIIGGEMIESSATVGKMFRTYMRCVRAVFKHGQSHHMATARARAGQLLQVSSVHPFDCVSKNSFSLC
jgi:hypothetical protein